MPPVAPLRSTLPGIGGVGRAEVGRVDGAAQGGQAAGGDFQAAQGAGSKGRARLCRRETTGPITVDRLRLPFQTDRGENAGSSVVGQIGLGIAGAR